jgi:hypothetical protein
MAVTSAEAIAGTILPTVFGVVPVHVGWTYEYDEDALGAQIVATIKDASGKTIYCDPNYTEPTVP